MRIPIPYLSVVTKKLEFSVSQEWFLLFVFCFLTAISVSVVSESVSVSVSTIVSGVSESASISISTSISTMSVVSVVSISIRGSISISGPLGNNMGSIWSIGSIVEGMVGIWVSNMAVCSIWVGSMGIGKSRGSNSLHSSDSFLSRLFSSSSSGDNSRVDKGETSISKVASITSITEGTSIAEGTSISVVVRIAVSSIKECGISLSISLGLRGGISSSKQTNLKENMIVIC